MKSFEDIRVQLGVDVLVGMNEYNIVDRNSSIGTFGLLGCTCVVAEKGNEILLAHFDPICKDLFVNTILNFAPEHITLVTPGTYVKIEKKCAFVPEKDVFQSTSIQKTIIPYDMNNSFNSSVFYRTVLYKNNTVMPNFTASIKEISKSYSSINSFNLLDIFKKV